jgi:hypothetical protein
VKTVHVEAEYDGQPESVALVRRFVAGALQAWNLDSLSDKALLAASELASNAVTHVGDRYRLVVDYEEPNLHIEVIDVSPDLPVMVNPPVDSETGRGLVIVDALASTWLAKPLTGPGKTVYCELELPEQAPDRD